MESCCLPCNLQVQTTIESDRIVVSSKTYNVGDVVFENRPFTWLLRSELWSQRCAMCFKTNDTTGRALLRCGSCKMASYCTAQCQKFDWALHHKVECKQLSEWSAIATGDLLDSAMLSGRTLRRLNETAKLGKVSSCTVEIASEGFPVVSCSGGHYQDLVTGQSYDDEVVAAIECTCKLVQCSVPTAAKLTLAARCNNFGVMDDLMHCLAAGVYPLAAALNHSCAPNCFIQFGFSPKGPSLRVVALRPIAVGEELCHSYTDLSSPTEIRQQKLRAIYGFECRCSRCSASAAPALEQSVEVSSAFVADIPNCMDDPKALRDCLDKHLPPEYVLHHLTTEVLSQERVEETLLECARLQELATKVDLEDNDPTTAAIYIRQALSALGSAFGKYNHKIYSLRGNLLALLLRTGDLVDAVSECSQMISYQLLSLYPSCPTHPLLGLQLYTLGDLLSCTSDSTCSMTAVEAYRWALEILQVTYSADSSILQNLKSIATKR